MTVALLPQLVAQVIAGAATGAPAELAPAPPVELTSVGTTATLLTWAALLAINLWCLRRILRRRPEGSA
ncbi:MAG: hypothetical protein ACYTF3_05045 [Planctomycetota bacterium]